MVGVKGVVLSDTKEILLTPCEINTQPVAEDAITKDRHTRWPYEFAHRNTRSVRIKSDHITIKRGRASDGRPCRSKYLNTAILITQLECAAHVRADLVAAHRDVVCRPVTDTAADLDTHFKVTGDHITRPCAASADRDVRRTVIQQNAPPIWQHSGARRS